MRKAAIQILCTILIVLLQPSLGRAQSKPADPAKAKEHAERAEIAYDSGHWNTAIAELGKAYDYDPQPKYLYNVGLAAEDAGMRQKALEAFRAYLAKDKDGPYAVTARAKVDKIVAALARDKHAAKEAKVAGHLAKAKAEHTAARHGAAAYEYQQVYKLTENAEYLFEAAESLRRMNAKDRAIAGYKAYLDADSAGKFAADAREQLKSLESEPDELEASLTAQPVATTSSTSAVGSSPKRNTKWVWLAAGAAAIVAGIAADTIPAAGSNGQWDFTDVLPLGLYGAGVGAVFVGVF